MHAPAQCPFCDSSFFSADSTSKTTCAPAATSLAPTRCASVPPFLLPYLHPPSLFLSFFFPIHCLELKDWLVIDWFTVWDARLNKRILVAIFWAGGPSWRAILARADTNGSKDSSTATTRTTRPSAASCKKHRKENAALRDVIVQLTARVQELTAVLDSKHGTVTPTSLKCSLQFLLQPITTPYYSDSRKQRKILRYLRCVHHFKSYDPYRLLKVAYHPTATSHLILGRRTRARHAQFQI